MEDAVDENTCIRAAAIAGGGIQHPDEDDALIRAAADEAGVGGDEGRERFMGAFVHVALHMEMDDPEPAPADTALAA
jgi:hypothetical protein